MVQHAAVVTMLVARDGTVESCSGAVSRMLGHDPELVEGRPLVNLVTSDDRQAVMEAIVRAAAGRGRGRTGDGHRRPDPDRRAGTRSPSS